MSLRCPRCNTRYAVDPDALVAADGLAHCRRCGLVFDAVAGDASKAAEGLAPLRPDAHNEFPAVPDEQSRELPFEVPDDLPPLLPSDDGALDIGESLHDKPSARGFWYGLVAFLLLASLSLQLAWRHRIDLLERFPVLEPLCDHLACRPGVIHAPAKLRILQRDLQPTRNDPGSLTLTARVRNDADTAQPIPDIQLSLLETDGGVLIRRRLSPAEYMYPPPANGRLIAPGEVFTIDLDFKDPGTRATGFAIDFL